MSERDFILNFNRKYSMPITRSQQSEAENTTTGLTPEMENSAEIRLENNLKMLKRLGEQTKDIIESRNERKWQ